MSHGNHYVYAVLARGTCLPSRLTGLGGDLMLVPYRELAAAASIIDRATMQPTAQDVLRHEAIVEALRESGPTLPVRFGTVLTDAQAVAHALSERYDVLLDDLARLGDKVECGLVVLWREVPPVSNRTAEGGAVASNLNGREEARGPGAEYLRARTLRYRSATASHERAHSLVQDLDIALRPHAIDSRVTIAPTAGIALRAAYLLRASAVGPFGDAFEEVRGMRPDLRFLLSGPWPPYSFVTKPANLANLLRGSSTEPVRPESLEGSNDRRQVAATGVYRLHPAEG